MRCLAFAQAWQSHGGAVHFVMAEVTSAIEARLREENALMHDIDSTPGSQEDARQTAEYAHRQEAEWVVVDGYHFGAAYQRRLKDENCKVLFLDDYGHAKRYEADLVLNQNIDAEASLYADRATDTELLLGPEFALLRNEFWPWRSPRRVPREKAHRVLVTLGGADPDNITRRTVDALGQMSAKNVHVTVVVGGSNPHENEIRTAAEATDATMEVLCNVDDMASLMAESDVAVSAGGSTCWELAFMGVPNAIIILADNQEGIAKGLDKTGAAVNMGRFREDTPKRIASEVADLLNNDERRLGYVNVGQTLVDGYGVDRAAKRLNQGFWLREVRDEDCKRLWEWANDPDVRKRSYDSAPIPWSDHQDWFDHKIASPSCVIYIAELRSKAVGQIRFDVDKHVATVSVVVAPGCRGEGIGTKLIREGSERFLYQYSGAKRVDAYIKTENAPSVRAFKKAGYQTQERLPVEGALSYRLCYSG